jgi:hypothetical protein
MHGYCVLSQYRSGEILSRVKVGLSSGYLSLSGSLSGEQIAANQDTSHPGRPSFTVVDTS